MKKIIKILVGAVTVLSILLFITWQSADNQELQIHFFDIGQGDGILIRTPSQQNIVIDGGPDNSFITKLGQALPFYDQKIDLMVLTHPHDDHIFGLVEVLKRYKVKQVLYSGVLHTTDAYLEWLNQILEKEIQLKIAMAGQQFVFDEAELKVIYPIFSQKNQKVKNLNNSSVVVQLIFNEVKVLFTGDLEKEGEEEILQLTNFNLESQVIKLGHHGSDTSSSEEFVKAIDPEYAVIQVGQDNKFGHPSLRVLKRMERLGVNIYRTDIDGDIIIATDGERIWRK